jgi:hypothetical protein
MNYPANARGDMPAKCGQPLRSRSALALPTALATNNKPPAEPGVVVVLLRLLGHGRQAIGVTVAELFELYRKAVPQRAFGP